MGYVTSEVECTKCGRHFLVPIVNGIPLHRCADCYPEDLGTDLEEKLEWMKSLAKTDG